MATLPGGCPYHTSGAGVGAVVPGLGGRGPLKGRAGYPALLGVAKVQADVDGLAGGETRDHPPVGGEADGEVAVLGVPGDPSAGAVAEAEVLLGERDADAIEDVGGDDREAGPASGEKGQ